MIIFKEKEKIMRDFDDALKVTTDLSNLRQLFETSLNMTYDIALKSKDKLESELLRTQIENLRNELESKTNILIKCKADRTSIKNQLKILIKN